MAPEHTENRLEGSADSSKSLIETVFPNQAANALKIAFLFAGSLILFPFILLWLAPTVIAPYQVNILICVGIALLFAATGSQATLRIGGVVLAGGAAIAIASFLILENHRVDQENREAKKREYVRGRLLNVDTGLYDVRITLGKPVLGFPLYSKSRYDFVIFRNEIDQSFATVELERSKLKGENSAVPQNITITIPRGCIENMLGRELEWEYRPPGDNVRSSGDNAQTSPSVIFDRILRQNIGKFPRRFDEDDSVACNTDAHASDRTWQDPTNGRWAFLPTAWAQGGGLPVFGDKLIAQLQSDDTNVRRSARDELASLPPESLRPALDTLRNLGKITTNVENRYRLKLGLCIGFAQMLRLDPYKATRIREILTDADRTALLEAAGDEDRTVHIYATEFLYDLHDRKITKLALQRAAEPADTETEKSRRFQLLFVAKSIWPTLPDGEKSELRPYLEEVRKHSSSDPKTLELLAKFS
jgi:hypothetical protein